MSLFQTSAQDLYVPSREHFTPLQPNWKRSHPPWLMRSPLPKRSEARWQQQERGELDFDAKNMMHAVRLLLSGRSNELQRIEREFGVRTLLARLSLFAVPKKSKQLIVKVTSSKGLHYATHVSRGIDCACLAVILGGGCAGNFQPSRSRIIRCSVSGCV